MGLAAVNSFTQDVVCKLLEPLHCDGVKALVKAIIARLAGSLSTAMPSDAKHKQHLSCIAQWLQAGMKKKGLKMDCAGLTLAVLCLSQLLQDRFPDLAGVRMVVCSDALKTIHPVLCTNVLRSHVCTCCVSAWKTDNGKNATQIS